VTKRKVLLFSDGDDMAGVNYGLMQAINRHSTKYTARQIRGTDNYIHYPVDIVWMGNNTLVNQLYQEADLVHISEYPWALDGNSAPKIWDKRRLPTVLHQHGVPFRASPQKFLDIARREGYTQVVSTVDLLTAEDLTWLPSPVDILRLQGLREEHYPNDGVVRIGQAPTNRGIKNTAEFIEVCKDLQRTHGIEYNVFESMSWEKSLASKARMDIWFDQLTYGYGSNGIEAFAMGIATVGGFADKVHHDRYVGLVGAPPFYPATVATLHDVLRRLVEDVQLRLSVGQDGFDIVQRVHGEVAVVKTLEEIYDRTIERG
jgi:hypothetical protein